MPDPTPARITGGVVQELISYPIKGCAGTSLAHAIVTPAGLAHDRSFMVVNPDGVFRSQRHDPLLAIIRPQVSPDGAQLTLHAPDTDPVCLAVDIEGLRRDVLLFGAPFQGIDQGDAVAGWLSRVLSAPSRLVRVPPEHDRVTGGQTPGTAGYADGCAVHLLSQSSLDLLNERLRGRGAAPLPMSRFRPNIVVDGWPDPHTEDQTRRISIGTVELSYAKAARRCEVTTVDQYSAVKSGPEPLRTLALYRRVPGGLAFGVNYAVTRPGEVSTGAPVIVKAAEPASQMA